MNQIKMKYMNENGETDIIGFGQFVFDIGTSLRESRLSDIGTKIVHSCLGKLPNDHFDRSRCYDALGLMASTKANLDESFD